MREEGVGDKVIGGVGVEVVQEHRGITCLTSTRLRACHDAPHPNRLVHYDSAIHDEAPDAWNYHDITYARIRGQDEISDPWRCQVIQF